MTHTLIPSIIAFVILLALSFIPETPRCPKCGVPMEPYDDKRDVCVNPNCPIKR